MFVLSYKFYNQISGVVMNNKRKPEHVSYGITKNEANYQIGMIELMSKLLDQTRTNNLLLRKIFDVTEGRQVLPPVNPQAKTLYGIKRNETGVLFYQPKSRTQLFKNMEAIQDDQNKQIKQSRVKEQAYESNKKQNESANEPEEDTLKKILQHFQQGFIEVTKTNKKIFEVLNEMSKNNQEKSSALPSQSVQQHHVDQHEKLEEVLLEVLSKKQKIEKKTYGHYGIISEIMPFSDKRQIKVRYKIVDIMETNELSQSINMDEFKKKTTQWIGMVFRATASICWNMLYGAQLNFEEVKVLFTENIIFNFIEYMKDIEPFINEQKRLEMTNHINYISCEVLEFLCRQYPQTKVQAPNIALRKSIPIIENQGQSKFDLVTMVCRDTVDKQDQEKIKFEVRIDKDYSSTIMKVINYMIDQTEEQFTHFEKVMTNIFERIFLSKEKRGKIKGYDTSPLGHEHTDSQYRQKVKAYSSYVIGRKIPKNTPKYSKNEIQYGVFFVKAPSILRIITKWFQQLWEFVNTPIEKLKTTTNEIKDHEGRVLNISTRVKHLLYQNVTARLGKIQTKIERIKTECYNMEYLLSGTDYTMDSKQIHLSQDQLSVGKYCSNLKNAISSYVCAQLSKIIFYLLLIPLEIDEKVLQFNDEDFQQQARKHLDNTNLVSLKIFDLLRCKCHSNEQQIIYIVQTLKQFEKDDPKFEIVRVKDRLNQGTRDILINAQYNGGLVWEIQLAVTSHLDKKQDLLDKYNHFLYELKRNKLGPISECVSIWSSLEQRSLYFEQLIRKRKDKGSKCTITHGGKKCKEGQLSQFSEFKRSIICRGCKEYFAIPLTSLLNVRCQVCRVTYCGLCFYASLSQFQRKRFMFQNFDKKKLLNSVAFNELQEYTDFKKPLPKQGFFIKKRFLNRELSYFSITKVDKSRQNPNEYIVSISQIIIRNGAIDIRSINKNQVTIIDKDGQYFLKGSEKETANSIFNEVWIFYFRNRKPQQISVSDLETQLKDPAKAKMKYLNVLFEPNYMTELKLHSKIFEKVRLIKNIKNTEDIENYKISIYRFPSLTILAKLNMQQKVLQQLLIKKSNRATLRDFAQKKISIINMEQYDLTDEIDYLINTDNEDIRFYFMKVQKLYLADNNIENIKCFKQFKNLESLSISKNYLKNLNGIEDLVKLYYLKFDENNISSLTELKNLINLTYVSGNINEIISLEGLENLQNLGSLSLCQNKISEISQIKGLSKLRRIYLRDNPIKTVAQLKDIQIKHLYVGGTFVNPLQIVTITCITTLKELSLKNMKLASIPDIFDKAQKLEELKLSRNNITKIEHVERAVNIIRLDLNDNEITVMENLATLINLEVLSLKNNKITVVEGVKTYIESLKALHLENNPLDDVSDYLMYEQKSTSSMRLKFTEQTISAKAKEQLKNHTLEIGSKSESDD